MMGIMKSRFFINELVLMRVLFFLALFFSTECFADEVYRWNLGDAIVTLSDSGKTRIFRPDGSPFSPEETAFRITSNEGKRYYPTKVVPQCCAGGEDRFEVFFQDGSIAKYVVTPQNGFALVTLLSISEKTELESCDLFVMSVPYQRYIPRHINTATLPDGFRLGVMTTSINVLPSFSASLSHRGDSVDCSHSFIRLVQNSDNSEAKDTTEVAEFCARSERMTNDGWSIRGRDWDTRLDLSKTIKLRARIHGDGQGEQLKIQLIGDNGYRDDYVTVDFTGWKICELDSPELDSITYDKVDSLFFYFNSLPSKTTVRCLIDWVDVVLDDGAGGEKTIRLEDFSSEFSPYWDQSQSKLSAKSFARHSLFPASCAIIATNGDKWATTVEKMQAEAGIPSPRPGNGWRGDSPNVHDSYFFLTSFNANELEDALEIIKRGGFKQVLLDQNSWCQSTGTYHVNERNFPGGLRQLKEIAKGFNNAGIRFGLHLLAASVDSHDPYLSPVPDSRFVTDVSSNLATSLDEDETTIFTTDDATMFPADEDAYMGAGQVVRIDDELIEYGKTLTTGLYDCKRGLYGTIVVPHDKGTSVSHFTRSYGYHKPDLDTAFIDEIASNFAKVANALPLDMIYFDGSELLQRSSEGSEHWYYNARLHKSFYDKLENKDILFQASSCSPFSWHMISRNASADGHDDLKAYLEERSGGFSSGSHEESYLDVGWYYAYDRNATPDMYEYCLGATIGYGASFSFQTSVMSAKHHPFIGEILDLIREYENLRLSGRIPEDIRSLFILDKKLAGVKTFAERNALLGLRNEFCLEKSSDGKDLFRRVIFPLWHNVGSGDSELGGTTINDANEENGVYTWEQSVDVQSQLGFQVHYKSEGIHSDEIIIVNPSIRVVRIDEGREEEIGKIQLGCELSVGQFAFALPRKKEKKYGYPLMTPETIGGETPSICLEPGVYRITFDVDSGLEAPLRVRTPLYTNETFVIPE